jgi:hypothetical protein
MGTPLVALAIITSDCETVPQSIGYLQDAFNRYLTSPLFHLFEPHA